MASALSFKVKVNILAKFEENPSRDRRFREKEVAWIVHFAFMR
jgi:hypothetical protein